MKNAEDTDELAFLENASASFSDLAENGPPVSALHFEPARVGNARRVDAAVYNPVICDVLEVSNIIYERHADGRPPERAYWVGRKLKNCSFGVVRSCTLLKFRNTHDAPWEVTERKAAVKVMSWQKIRELHRIGDPKQEVAAMQFISQHGFHPHVVEPIDILQDEDYLLLFMPFYSSGDLFGFVEQAGRLPEENGRYWFKQILEALSHLQMLGVCHRDLALENVLVDQHQRAVLFDFGLCLRVPFAADRGVTDVSGGNLRRLIKPMVPCGKPIYISPEVLESKEPFDGFAVDLWAAGVMLFIMLVGLPPWEFARREDPRYRLVVAGQLAKMLTGWQREVSPLGTDLLQKMLQDDPRKRLSLTQVKEHPWVVGE